MFYWELNAPPNNLNFWLQFRRNFCSLQKLLPSFYCGFYFVTNLQISFQIFVKILPTRRNLLQKCGKLESVFNLWYFNQFLWFINQTCTRYLCQCFLCFIKNCNIISFYLCYGMWNVELMCVHVCLSVHLGGTL